MSGIVKHVKKTFKRHLKTVKKWGKWVALAVAVYFTAGLALSAMPATASFAAAMPGFAGGGFAGLGIGAGATAGTGIFTQAAAAMGLGTLGSAGGLVGGALQGGSVLGAAAATPGALAGAGISAGTIATGAAEAGIALGGAAGGAAGTVGLGGAGALGGGVASTGIEGTVGLASGTSSTLSGAAANVGISQAAGAAGAAGAGAAGGGAIAAKAGMGLTEKLLLASVGTQTVGALLGPSPAEIAREQAKADKTFYGAFYGMEADGSGGGAVVPKPAAMSVAAPKIQAPGGAAARTAGTQATKDLFPNALQVNQDQEGDQNLFAPMQGVRYV